MGYLEGVNMMDREPEMSKYRRYQRQAIIPEIGWVGQRRLRDARVLVVGAGGLGAPVILYLGAAGIGTIGIVDGDKVEESNLHRQVIHMTDRIGSLKTSSASDFLARLNPDVKVDKHPVFLDPQNAEKIIGDYDIVVNRSDNFAARYLINDTCQKLNKPLIDASITHFMGQGTVYMPDMGCYRCLYPAPPPDGVIPSCADSGIIGAVSGFMGTWQAMETIKVLLGIGIIPVEKLVIFNLLTGFRRELSWEKDPTCPVCGEQAADSLVELHEQYNNTCSFPSNHDTESELHEVKVNVDTVREWLHTGREPILIDIREIEPKREELFPGAKWVHIDQLDEFLQTVPQTDIKPIVLICSVGLRSNLHAEVMRQDGYKNIYSMEGGSACIVQATMN